VVHGHRTCCAPFTPAAGQELIFLRHKRHRELGLALIGDGRGTVDVIAALAGLVNLQFFAKVEGPIPSLQ